MCHNCCEWYCLCYFSYYLLQVPMQSVDLYIYKIRSNFSFCSYIYSYHSWILTYDVLNYRWNAICFLNWCESQLQIQKYLFKSIICSQRVWQLQGVYRTGQYCANHNVKQNKSGLVSLGVYSSCHWWSSDNFWITIFWIWSWPSHQFKKRIIFHW